MHTIKVNLKNRPYDIITGYAILKGMGKYLRALRLGPDAYIITNKLIKNRYGHILDNSLKAYGFNVKFKLIPDTEKSKSLKIFSDVIKALAAYDRKKLIFLIAFGGGVVGDLTGFISSVYKRGIAYIQIPTTLLAQVDSGIGGKTGIDLECGKNLAGTFYQPQVVFSDTKLLETLKPKQLRDGMSEIIKYGIIKDKNLFRYLERNYRDILNLRRKALESVVSRCSAIKAQVVAQDEREEKGLRTTLNFGHTIGHAIEAAGNYRLYSHGEAVALGMLVACDISRAKGLIPDKLQRRIEILIQNTGLPVRIRNLGLEDIIRAHYRDKKFTGPVNKFVLIKGIGKTKIVRNLPLKLIRAAVRKRLS